MKKIILLMLLIAASLSCRKSKTQAKLIGTWNLTEHKIDGVMQEDTNKRTRLVFKGNQESGQSFQYPIEGGFQKMTEFKYFYYPKGKKIRFMYATKIEEEFEIEKIKTIPGWLSYDEEEDAKEEYMILKNGNEEYRFVKEYEE